MLVGLLGFGLVSSTATDCMMDSLKKYGNAVADTVKGWLPAKPISPAAKLEKELAERVKWNFGAPSVIYGAAVAASLAYYFVLKSRISNEELSAVAKQENDNLKTKSRIALMGAAVAGSLSLFGLWMGYC